MEKKTIKGIIDYERTQLFLVFIVTTIIFISLIYVTIRNVSYSSFFIFLIIATYLYVRSNYKKLTTSYYLYRVYKFLKKIMN